MTLRHALPRPGTHVVVSCATTVCLGGMVLATLASHLVVNTTPSAPRRQREGGVDAARGGRGYLIVLGPTPITPDRRGRK